VVDSVVLIDPVLSNGSKYFDLAKFVSRHIIDSAPGYPSDLVSFFKGYGLRPTEDMSVYGPLKFSDLVAVDLLNICRSYVKRYAAEDKEYRLTRSLDSQDFCTILAATMRNLMTTSDTSKLDNILGV
jgi:hypothetical protein